MCFFIIIIIITIIIFITITIIIFIIITEGLDYLGRQVIYYDTDSIIYSYIPNSDDKEIITLERLGCFENEKGFNDSNYAIEFVSGGPKNYSYLMNNNHSICKVKGVTLNYENSNI